MKKDILQADTPKTKNKALSRSMWKSLSNVNWNKNAEIVLKFLTDEKRTFVPKVINKYGPAHFRLEKNKVFLFNREIITSDKRRKEILDREENKFGGIRKSHERLMRKYINISRKQLRDFYAGSERRQLKYNFRTASKKKQFIHAPAPGLIQMDLTFYKKSAVPVFGFVDVFSRWAYYERLTSKKASLVIHSIQRAIKEFEKISKHRVYKLTSDAGSEFIHKDTKTWLKKSHIAYNMEAKPRKLIESLNKTLRRYVERIGFDTLKDLDDLIEGFVETYNETKHSSTGKVPNELVAIEKTKAVKDESKRQLKTKLDAAKGSSYKMAKLKVGDTVRIYDPRRREIKAEQKAQLKGKIKLSEKDYVKKYTSSHRGPDPHWTKKTYKIIKIIVGRQAPRFKLEDRKETFIRAELQRVSKVTKADPRQKLTRLRKERAEKLKELLPAEVRKEKYLRKELIVKDYPDIPAVVLEIYKNHMIVFYDSNEISWVRLEEVAKLSGKTTSKSEVETWKKDNPDEINHARKEIDEEIDEAKAKVEKLIPI